MDEPKFPDDKAGMSGTTLALLIVLAIVISVIGTWAVINSMHPATSEINTGSTGTNSAQVSINIQRPPTTANSNSVGEVMLNIQKP